MTDPYRSLLDLLAGWAEYVDRCQDTSNNPCHYQASGDDVPREAYSDECDAVHDLYQEAGRSRDDSPEFVEWFMKERVMPLLRKT